MNHDSRKNMEEMQRKCKIEYRRREHYRKCRLIGKNFSPLSFTINLKKGHFGLSAQHKAAPQGSTTVGSAVRDAGAHHPAGFPAEGHHRQKHWLFTQSIQTVVLAAACQK